VSTKGLVRRVAIQNVGSIANASFELENDVTVLVGVNGSGKTSLMKALSLPGRIAVEGMEATLRATGGFRTLHGIGPATPITVRLDFTIENLVGHYEMTIDADAAGVAFTSESMSLGPEYHLSRRDLGRPNDQISILDIADFDWSRRVRNFVRGVQVYWGNLVALTEAVLSAEAGERMDVCSYNWPETVKRILASERANDFRRAMRHFTGDISDIRFQDVGGNTYAEAFRLHPNGTVSHLGETGIWLSLSHLSEGTVRTLDLLTALMQDSDMSVIAFEHPEDGIHPGMASLLVDYAQETAVQSQVILSTHSPDVLHLVEPRSIRVVEKRDGFTSVGPLETNQIELVEDGLFGLDELLRIEGLRPASAA
jgi:AAA domain, putative AbiEii toxin, Type IV TA system/AAA domain